MPTIEIERTIEVDVEEVLEGLDAQYVSDYFDLYTSEELDNCVDEAREEMQEVVNELTAKCRDLESKLAMAIGNV